MLQRKVVEKIKIHILCPAIFFFESRTVYEIMWKNTDPEKPQMTIRGIHISRWVPKAINTYTYLEYVILIAFELQQ